MSVAKPLVPAQAESRPTVAATAAAVLGYLRPGQEVEDARELTLTLILWASSLLADVLKAPAVIADYRRPGAPPR
ncbi:hypothetical protein ACODT3_43110 [Streptomyces sp. 4.24]|uniref:hypothetical protein n=1 Tax=Streptomyces tritrimontium TaxID=3406573 RepID=UPI003BB4E8F2